MSESADHLQKNSDDERTEASEDTFFGGDGAMDMSSESSDTDSELPDEQLTETETDNCSTFGVNGDDGNDTGQNSNLCYFNGIHLKDLTKEHMLGVKFDSVDDFQRFLDNYSSVVGFSLRKSERKLNKMGLVILRRWVCSNEGEKTSKCIPSVEGKSREPRGITKVGCKSSFKINYYRGQTQYQITEFMTEHNHALVEPRLRHFLRCKRQVTNADLNSVKTMHRVGIRMSQAMALLVDACGGFDKVGFTLKDLQNKIDGSAKVGIGDTDAESALAYIKGLAEVDPGFFCQYSVDDENRLANIFWRDSICKNDYDTFGNVVAFDATYKRNAYGKPLVILVGVNNHMRTNVFGYGLLINEKKSTYIWLLKTFLQSMGNREPDAVVTDGDKAMRRAVKTLLPNTKHRLCSWHLANNAARHLGNDDAVAFGKVMSERYASADEFELTWSEFLCRGELMENQWVLKQHKLKGMWAEPLLRGTFFAGMTTTQRCESMNSHLNIFLHIRLRMYEFVRQIERSLTKIRHTEAHDDYYSRYTKPPMATHLRPIEKHISEIYTKQVYLHVKDVILREALYLVMSTRRLSDRNVYTLEKYPNGRTSWDVSIRLLDKHINCSCLAFETDGLPCCHMFAVMKVEKLEELPPSLILNRWRKYAKSDSNTVDRANIEDNEFAVATRYSSFLMLSSKFSYFVSKKPEWYSDARRVVTELCDKYEGLAYELQHLSCDDGLRGTSTGNFVRDPVIVQTKGRPSQTTSFDLGSSRPTKQQRQCQILQGIWS